MKTTLSLVALLFVSSFAFAQTINKTLDTTKQQRTRIIVAKQTQGATFGEKVKAQNPLYNGNHNSGENPLFDPKAKTVSKVGPIKGVIVKGSKNN